MGRHARFFRDVTSEPRCASQASQVWEAQLRPSMTASASLPTVSAPEDVLWTCVSDLRSSQSIPSSKSGSGSEWEATHDERQAPAPRSLAVRDRPLRTSRSCLEASPPTKPRPRLFVRGHRIRPRTIQYARALAVTPHTNTRARAHDRRFGGASDGPGCSPIVEPRCMALRKLSGSPIERAFVREKRARSSDKVRLCPLDSYFGPMLRLCRDRSVRTFRHV